jgi:hypothetical protein
VKTAVALDPIFPQANSAAQFGTEGGHEALLGDHRGKKAVLEDSRKK